MATRRADLRDPSPDLLTDTAAAVVAARRLLGEAREAVLAKGGRGGRLDADLLEREQHAAHGLAWLDVYVEALAAMHGWASGLREAGRLGEREALMLGFAFAEYSARIAGGIPMSQVEIVRPQDLGLGERAVQAFVAEPAVRRLVAEGGTAERRARRGKSPDQRRSIS